MLARRLVLGSAVVAALSVLLALAVWLATSTHDGSGADRPVMEPTTEPVREPRSEPAGAVRALADWDERRASAWAAGDVRRLRDLYVDGSRTGRADAAMLSAWVHRGLSVHGLRTQVLRVRVLRHGDRSVLVEVTDRMVGGIAVGRGRRVPLPTDRATTRKVVLRRVAGTWLVEEVSTGATGPVSPARWR